MTTPQDKLATARAEAYRASIACYAAEEEVASRQRLLNAAEERASGLRTASEIAKEKSAAAAREVSTC